MKRTSSWNKACEELKKHQDLLEKLRVATNNFTTAPPDSSSESEAESTHVCILPKLLIASVAVLVHAPCKFLLMDHTILN